MSNADWAKYLVYCIHEIWFLFLSILLPTINDQIAPKLMDYALFLIEDLKSEKNKIFPTRSLYTKIIRSCSRSTLESYVNQVFSIMPQSYKINNPLYYSAFMNGLYDDFSQMIKKSNGSSTDLFDMSIDLSERMSILLKRKTTVVGCKTESSYKKNINFLINSSIFVPYEFCAGCFKSGKAPKKLGFIDIISGFRRDFKAEHSICSFCHAKILPKLYIVFENQTNLENVEITNLISPVKLTSEIDKIIKEKGDKYFFISEYHNDEEHRQIFWNILFYFQLFNLPTVVLTLQHDITKLRAYVDEMQSNMEIVRKQSSLGVLHTQHSYGALKTINNDFGSNESDNDSSDHTSPTASFNNNEKILQNKM